MPFGEELYADTSHRTTANKYNSSGEDAVRKRFTGYEKDNETGLDFAEARYYNHQHARFTAVDPLLASGKSSNPQTFNRYIYCLNNPLIFTDPTGLQAGKWYRRVDEDGNPAPWGKMVYQSTHPGSLYQEVTTRNAASQLILIGGAVNGTDLGPNWVIHLNEDGPSPDVMDYDALGLPHSPDFHFFGFEIIKSDAYEATFIEHPSAGYERGSELVGFELFLTAQSVWALGRAGISTIGKGAMEGKVLMRTMKVGDDGLPVPGQSATTLGARESDIIAGKGGLVGPNAGGMSVTPAGGTLPHMGGKNLQTFCIKCNNLPSSLRYRADPSNPLNHGFIEPSRSMTFDQYQRALQQTRPWWKSQ